MIRKIEMMSLKELRNLSLMKEPNGSATKEARAAQEELQARSLHYDGDKDNRYTSSDMKSFEDYDDSSEDYIDACGRVLADDEDTFRKKRR